MKIVIDTNVVISGVFFGGKPRMILEAVADGKLYACASAEILCEYYEIIDEMISRGQGHFNRNVLLPLISAMEIVIPVSTINASRDPDDNKFIECANDSGALYIVSGDKDLLDIQEYNGVQIVTASDFCSMYSGIFSKEGR
ncbi:MAG: putative toxin-antitoxin system toxin component, PIN family [Synergistaceae bacterium]|nr:putative toxin-antitoxin system toxin component, PIN family [Synergistaceae bacterium]